MIVSVNIVEQHHDKTLHLKLDTKAIHPDDVKKAQAALLSASRESPLENTHLP